MQKELPNTSPFSELTFTQQQERWREYRSRPLDYKQAPMPDSPPDKAPDRQTVSAQEGPRNATLRMPPPRHSALDDIAKKHLRARAGAGAWQRS